MNERVEELAALAFRSADLEDPAWFRKHNEKFAELIIKESCKIIKAGEVPFSQIPVEVALDMTSKNIKAYFEVE